MQRAALRGAAMRIALAAALAAGTPAGAETLRVGTSGDYRPFSYSEAPGAPAEGFDIALLRAWAAERGHEIVWRSFGWPKLLARLAADDFDLAASGITLRPERSAAGRFSVAVAETSAWVLARDPGRWSGSASLDRPQIRIAVNAGGHLERVARARFPRATLLAVPDNRAVLELLIEERVHAVVTDSVEAPHWEERVGFALERVGPLTRDRKAWLVRAEHAELARDLDLWLLASEANGRLGALRAKWLGEASSTATADPVVALFAALDERLMLMPWVALAKRRGGVPLEVPEREEFVLDAAVAALAAAAENLEREAPPEAELRALFRAQMEAAKRLQRHAVADRDFDPADSEVPDLDAALRPALLRIGERIATLVLSLPPGLERETLRVRARDALRAPYLDDVTRNSLADAVLALSPRSD